MMPVPSPASASAPPAPPLGALAAECLTALAGRGETLALAESCTGGLVAAALTEVPGASAVLACSFVVYSNEAKIRLLGLAPALLAAEGAVSQETARAMALGALARSGAARAAAVTGIAGPGGASPGKPVGLVCFAFAGGGAPAFAETQRFEGSRARIQQEAAAHALARLASPPAAASSAP